MSWLWQSVLVGTGGFFGAVSRFAVGRLSALLFGIRFPYGTLAINVTGSFLLGLLSGLNVNSTVWLLFGTGFMGAFTTFSTFKVETVGLARERRWKAAAIYLGLSYTVGLLCAFAGYILGRSVYGSGQG